MVQSTQLKFYQDYLNVFGDLRRTYGCDDNDLDFEQWQFESRYAIFTPYVEDLTTDVTGINKYIVKP